MSVGNFPESLSQAMLVGIMLVYREIWRTLLPLLASICSYRKAHAHGWQHGGDWRDAQGAHEQL